MLISAGFDAHRDDPLADCMLEAESFGRMTRRVCEMASETDAPVGAVLEGGYDLDALADSRARHDGLLLSGSAGEA